MPTKINVTGQGLLTQDVETSASTVRDALRVHTKDVHEQLHDHSHFVALFDGSITQTQYRALMKGFLGFYAPMERAIAQMPNQNGFSYPSRSHLLLQDVANLGLSSAELAQVPECAQMLNIVTPASLPGVLYVIEGSTLGAALIDRAAQKILSSDTTAGRNFWAWSRAQNKARWAALNTYLDHIDTTGQAHAPIIKGANDTFQALATWLAPLEHSHLAVKSVGS